MRCLFLSANLLHYWDPQTKSRTVFCHLIIINKRKIHREITIPSDLTSRFLLAVFKTTPGTPLVACCACVGLIYSAIATVFRDPGSRFFLSAWFSHRLRCSSLSETRQFHTARIAGSDNVGQIYETPDITRAGQPRDGCLEMPLRTGTPCNKSRYMRTGPLS